MSQLFIASELESLLQMWEDQNLAGEFDFQMTLQIKSSGGTLTDTKAGTYTEKLIGSEINALGTLMRSIPQYGKLRKVLSGVPVAHPTGFLPTVPKMYRDVTSLESFMEHQLVRGSISIPTFLQKWNETRRACIVEDTVPIPLLDLRQENWLEFLPYHAFYLKVRTPFVFPVVDGDYEFTVEDFLIYDNGDVVSIIFWQTDLANKCLNHQQRKDVEPAIANPKNKKLVDKVYANSKAQIVEMNSCCVCRINITKKGAMMRESRTQQFKETFVDFYHPDSISDDPKDLAIHQQMISVVELINGFCKLNAALPAKTPTAVAEVSYGKPERPEPHQWYELFLQTVECFHTDLLNKAVVLTRGTGPEKAPHYRRRHQRRIQQRDGTYRLVWVAESLVNEDKLLTDQLRGGALRIK